MDYYDVFYNHGILGFIVYFSVYIYSLYLVFKNLAKKIDFKQLMEYLSLIFGTYFVSTFRSYYNNSSSLYLCCYYFKETYK